MSDERYKIGNVDFGDIRDPEANEACGTAESIIRCIEEKFSNDERYKDSVIDEDFVQALRDDMEQLKKNTLDFSYDNLAKYTKENIHNAKSLDDIRIVSSEHDKKGLCSQLTEKIRTGELSPYISRTDKKINELSNNINELKYENYKRDKRERETEEDRSKSNLKPNQQTAGTVGIMELSKRDPFTAFVEGCKNGYDPIHYMEEKRQRLMAIYYYISEKDDAGVVRSEDDEKRVEQELNEKHGSPLKYLQDKIHKVQDKFEKAIGFSYVEYGKNRSFKENLHDMQFISDSDKPTNDQEVMIQFVEKELKKAPIDKDSCIKLSRFIEYPDQRVIYDQAVQNLNEKKEYSFKVMNVDREILNGKYKNMETKQEQLKSQEMAKSQGYVKPYTNSNEEGKGTKDYGRFK
jgi:hypothetical protein